MNKEWVMMVEGRNVYVGDKLFFTPCFGNEKPYEREVFIQHKWLAQNVKDWTKCWKWKQGSNSETTNV